MAVRWCRVGRRLAHQECQRHQCHQVLPDLHIIPAGDVLMRDAPGLGGRHSRVGEV